MRGHFPQRKRRAIEFHYTLDPTGNPTQAVRAGNAAETRTYAYDTRDRLTQVCFQAGTCPGSGDPFIRWSYDAVGNRLTEARPSGTTTYSYNAADHLLSAGSTSYSYDTNGNELSAGARSFSYDLANRLSSTASGGTTTSYGYDGDGNRLSATAGSAVTRFLWDEQQALPQLALERDGSNALLRRYLYGRQRISMFTGGASYYYHYDNLGSVANVTSASGVTQWTETYEPFGSIRTETKNQSSAPANFLKFTGEYADPTGLYYLRARQYDPSSGRFITPDPLASAPDSYISAYVYVDQRPSLLVDPSGLKGIPSGGGQAAQWDVTSPGAITGYSELVDDLTGQTLRQTASVSAVKGIIGRVVDKWHWKFRGTFRMFLKDPRTQMRKLVGYAPVTAAINLDGRKSRLIATISRGAYSPPLVGPTIFWDCVGPDRNCRSASDIEFGKKADSGFVHHGYSREIRHYDYLIEWKTGLAGVPNPSSSDGRWGPVGGNTSPGFRCSETFRRTEFCHFEDK